LAKNAVILSENWLRTTALPLPLPLCRCRALPLPLSLPLPLPCAAAAVVAAAAAASRHCRCRRRSHGCFGFLIFHEDSSVWLLRPKMNSMRMQWAETAHH